jgi:hypothetical protein
MSVRAGDVTLRLASPDERPQDAPADRAGAEAQAGRAERDEGSLPGDGAGTRSQGADGGPEPLALGFDLALDVLG